MYAAGERGVEHSVIEPLNSKYSNIHARINYPSRDCDMLLEINIQVKKGIRQGALYSLAENNCDSLVLAAHDLARAFESSIHEHFFEKEV